MVLIDEEETVEYVPGEIEVNGNFNQVGQCICSQDFVIEYLAKQLTVEDKLFDAVTTSHAFEFYVRESLQPKFTRVPRKVLKRKIDEFYSNYENELKDFLVKFNGNVVISCDVWSVMGDDDLKYVCVTCCWIGEDWYVEKRIVGFELIYPYGHVEIASRVLKVLDKFNLRGKVGSISFEDGFSREKCVECLLGSGGFKPAVLELFSHDRSFAYVVDLCAQLLVDQLALFIDPIRDLIKWIRVFTVGKRGEFKALCQKWGLKPVHFNLDCSDDWKSTFVFLQKAYEYRGVLSKLYNKYANQGSMIAAQWNAIKSILDLLGKFQAAEDIFGLAGDAYCHLVIMYCIKITDALKNYENDSRFCSVVRNIRRKWLEHFSEFPTIYCIASILDPRVKVDALRKLLAFYYETLGVNYRVEEKITKCQKVLHQLHAHYASMQDSNSKKGLRSRESNDTHPSSSESSFFGDILKRKRVDDRDSSGELGKYLFIKFKVPDLDYEEYFEISQWWKAKEEQYPVLSKVAKEILCIPISTTIPNSSYGPRKRLLDEKRSVLSPNLLRVCICKKDWDIAEEFIQGTMGVEGKETWTSSDSEADDY